MPSATTRSDKGDSSGPIDEERVFSGNEAGPDAGGRKNAPGALESAANDLRRNAGADQPAPADDIEFQEALSRQAVGLFKWAQGSNRLLEGASILARTKEGGQEHRIAEDIARQRYIKITHPDAFGMYPEPILVLDKRTQKLVPSFRLRRALPSEYLNRLLAHNEIFGDDHRLHGVFVHDGQLRTVISQPALKGVPPNEQEINDAMVEMSFEIVRSGGSKFFYRTVDNVAVFDGHEGNFLRTVEGVLPIDVIPVHPQGALLDAIREVRRKV